MHLIQGCGFISSRLKSRAFMELYAPMVWRTMIRPWLPVLLWMSLIFVGSTELLSSNNTSRFLGPIVRWFKPDVTARQLQRIHSAVRKLGHVTEYAVLAILVVRALRRACPVKVGLTPAKLALCVLVGCGAYAAGDELHQTMVSSRSGSLRDVMIDVGGVGVGLLLWWVFSKMMGTQKSGQLILMPTGRLAGEGAGRVPGDSSPLK